MGDINIRDIQQTTSILLRELLSAELLFSSNPVSTDLDAVQEDLLTTIAHHASLQFLELLTPEDREQLEAECQIERQAQQMLDSINEDEPRNHGKPPKNFDAEAANLIMLREDIIDFIKERIWKIAK